jgi:subtilisin family serine protease
MSRYVVAFIVGILATSVLASSSMRSAQAPGTAPAAARDSELMVKFRAGVNDQTRSALLQKHRMSIVNEFPAIGVFVIRLPSDMTVAQAVDELSKENAVQYAEPIFLTQMAQAQSQGTPITQVNPQRGPKDEPMFRETEVLVKFRPGVSGVDELRRQNMASIKAFSGLGLHVVSVPKGRGVDEIVRSLKGAPGVEYVEPNYIVRIEQRVSLTPNDPDFSRLWGLHNTGQTGGTADADIDAPEAWEMRTFASTVKVAVIDTGVDYNHPDLSANMWRNVAECNGTPNVDDDGDGIVDDCYGARWTNGDGTVTSGDPMDDNNHGTHCAGTISGVGNNGVGVAGVTWSTQIMALKFLNSGGSGSIADAIAAILFATSKGVNVMSNSWGGVGFSQALQDAIAAANTAGAVFVAAAGNFYMDTDRFPFYPSNYDVPNVISVTATDHNDRMAGFSDFGIVTVDLGAPGVSIYSTTRTNSYQFFSGTSMATPHVAGAAALLIAQEPGLTPAQVRSRLMATTDPIPSLTNRVFSGGRLNLHKAISPCPSTLSIRPRIPLNFVRHVGVDTVVSAALFSQCAIGRNATGTLSFNNGDSALQLKDDGIAPDVLAGDGVYTTTWRPGSSNNVTLTFSMSLSGLNASTTVVGTAIQDYYRRESIPFAFDDISSTGEDLQLTDDSVAIRTIPFNFKFYGRDYNQISIVSNGTINFEGQYVTYVPTCMPAEISGVTGALAPWWTDLRPGIGTGKVLYQVKGTAPNRYVVIQWNNVQRYPSSSLGVTFQVLLYEASRSFTYQYKNTAFGLPASDRGADAVVGRQKDSSDGASFSCSAPSLSDNIAFQFVPSVTTLPPPTLGPVTGNPNNNVCATVDSSTGFSRVRVTLTGTNFYDSTVSVSGGVQVTDVTVVNTTTITATFNVPFGLSLNAKTVTVTTPSGTAPGPTDPQVTWTPVLPAPTLTSLNPNSGRRNTYEYVTLTGTNFWPMIMSESSPSISSVIGIPSMSVNSCTTIFATFNLYNVNVGTYAIRAYTPTGNSNSVNFTVDNNPTVYSVDPSTGYWGTSVNATIYGLNLSGASRVVVILGSGATGLVPDIEIRPGGTDTSLPVRITIPPGAARYVNFAVTATSGTSAAGGGLSITPWIGASARADFDGDGKQDITVWRPETGTWYVTPSAGGTTIVRQWGATGDLPVAADYDGDGRADFAVWRPGDGMWLILLSGSSYSSTVRQLGLPNDLPVPGDYDGDRKADIAVWRPSNYDPATRQYTYGVWHMLKSGSGYTLSSQQFGYYYDLPVPADYDADGKTDVAVWRPTTGGGPLGHWYVLRSASGTVSFAQWGTPGDVPVPADYDGDRKADIGVWRPTNNSGVPLGHWYIVPSAGGGMFRQWGTPRDVPVPADYDGDGKADVGVWRPTGAMWYLLLSGSGGGASSHQLGAPGDIPLH